MTLLVDNDIVHKLAQLDLLGLATPLLINEYRTLLVLNTLRFKFCPHHPVKRAKLVKKYSVEVIDRIQTFIDTQVTEIDCEVTNNILLEAIISSEDDGLDIGEMQLLQTLIDSGDSSILTGDKRFLRALAKEKCMAVYSEKIERSFVCFEQIIIFLINKLGFELVKSRYISSLGSGLTVDTTLRMCFEGKELAQADRVLENLGTNVGYIRSNTESLLSPSEMWVPQGRYDVGSVSKSSARIVQ